MKFISHPPRKNTKSIALYNIKEINTILNEPFSFDVTNRYTHKTMVGKWSPIKLSINLDALDFYHINAFDEENHFVFSDRQFLFWFITNNSNKLIRVIGTEKSDYQQWDVIQNKFTPELIRQHKNNVKILNSEIYLKYGQELINKILAQ